MTSPALDTIAQVRKALAAASEASRNEQDRLAATHLQLAQVHATLVLAEQQRIANLIAWKQLHLDTAINEHGTRQDVGLSRDYLTDQIDYALDLDDMADDWPGPRLGTA